MANFERVIAEQREDFLHKIPLPCPVGQILMSREHEGLRTDTCQPRTRVPFQTFVRNIVVQRG